MIAPTARGGNTAAARLLRLALGSFDVPGTVRLWDGSVIPLTRSTPRFTITFRSRRTFRRLLRRPTALAFGEAFIDGRIDLDGDVFEAMRATHRLEAASWPLRTRLAMLAAWART